MDVQIVKLSFTILLFLICNAAISQCSYLWEFTYYDGEVIDTVQANYLINVYNEETNWHFDDIIPILNAAIDEYNIPIPAEIVAEYGWKSNHGGLQKVDSIEFAFYDTDTIRIRNKTIPVYNISSTLVSEWNEDFSRWYFYYCREFGVIGIGYYEFTGEQYLADKNYYLADKCNLSPAKRKLLTRVTDFVKKQQW